MSGSEKPLLVLPRRKSKKLELAHCPPKCELIHLNIIIGYTSISSRIYYFDREAYR